MFAIVDIETCGGKFDFRKGRIIEICIVKHDGLQVIDKFTSLVNPECYISPYFTNISGITNEMVADAPKFHEIAKRIIEITEGCIFVAHNVGFDYSFVKEEFASLGFKYKKDTLCTVRLSRKLIPGRISYSLGHLCASLGIEIEGRHRAEGDAVATAQLFDLLLALKSQHPQYRNVGVEEIMTRRIDKIKDYVLKKLPEECGVYYFINKEKEIIYVGKSTNIYQRAISHFNNTEKKGKKLLNDLYNADHVLTGSELIALLYESDEIKRLKPKYNRMRKDEEFRFSIISFKDKNGIINFALSENETENALVLQQFSNYSAAREKLETWIDAHSLCLRYCGLTSEDALCFNHQIKKCNGICNNEESAEVYNQRAQQLISSMGYINSDFIIVDKGRSREEVSLIMIKDHRYYGYGYMDTYHQLASFDDYLDLIKPARYFPDADLIIKGWLKSNRRHKIILPNKQQKVSEPYYYYD